MVLLGIDYGRRRIGLAVAIDSVIETRGWLDWGRKKQDSIRRIEKICQEEGVEKMIIGLSEGQMARETRRFGSFLSEVLKLPLEFVDESLTSWQAEKMVGWKNKGRVDSVSAALILERYLEVLEG